MAYWVVQANPNHFRIRDALQSLDQIVWRVPQYTDAIRAGDHAVIWESGKQAGIVGLGTFAGPPRLAEVPPDEGGFVADAAEFGADTRAPLMVKPVAHVPKAVVAETPDLSDHQIIRAPMGTVFPLTREQWAAFESLVDAAPPTFVATNNFEAVPAPFAWKDRRKDAYPMPGGYDGYLITLAAILEGARDQRWTSDELAKHVCDQFDVSATNARMMVLFLRRAGFLREAGGHVELTSMSEHFLETDNPDLVVAQLHGRVRFIGELLALLESPKTADELLDLANERFDAGWNSKAQIQRRRGWLQSAGAIRVDGDRRLSLTARGKAILGKLTLHEGAEASEALEGAHEKAVPIHEGQEDRPQDDRPVAGMYPVEFLIQRLTRTANDSTDPEAFELALRDAFQFLGFRAEKLGGPGVTDVVVDADIGDEFGYRVIVDGKTTSRGVVGDQQIDWDTIDEHRAKHGADYAVVAGPEFSGSRVFDRAAGHRALLLSANDMAELLRAHARSPFGFHEFRPIFEAEGAEFNLDALADSAESRERLIEVARAVLEAIEEHVAEIGPVTSRDLFLLLRSDEELDAQDDEIGQALEALASPLIGALVEHTNGYLPSGPRRTLGHRLDWLKHGLRAISTTTVPQESEA